MRSSATTEGRLREADERIHDPEAIEAKLSALEDDQKNLLLKLYRADQRVLNGSEAQMRAELLRLFKQTAEQIEADIFQTFNYMGAGDGWDFNAVRRVGRLQQLLAQVTNRVRALGGAMGGSFQDVLLDQFKKTWLDSSYRMDVLTPESVNIKFGLLPDREIIAVLNEPWSGARFSDRLGVITDEMAHNVRQQIIKSMMAEESWQDTARRIRGEMGTSGQKSVWRAEMVARTELAHAQTVANAALYAENKDVIEQVVWVAHPGACEDVCIPKHGQPVEEVGYPPEDSHPNCRCSILAVPKSWEGLAVPADGDFSLRQAPKKAWARDNGLGGTVE